MRVFYYWFITILIGSTAYDYWSIPNREEAFGKLWIGDNTARARELLGKASDFHRCGEPPERHTEALTLEQCKKGVAEVHSFPQCPRICRLFNKGWFSLSFDQHGNMVSSAYFSPPKR